MEKLVVATRNRGKLREIGAMLPDYELLTLADIVFTDEIPEPYNTFEENAHIKARTVYDVCGLAVMADDSGLCIDALEGRPGVDSATWSGLPRSDDRNIALVLQQLENVEQRRAAFVSCICLINASGTYYFKGICPGHIADSPKGDKGFGYDPIFIPEGYNNTFGELDETIKNSVSHRGKAVKALVHFLNREQAL